MVAQACYTRSLGSTSPLQLSSSLLSVFSTLPLTNSFICSLLTLSFSCTIFSDMVCRLFSNGGITTSFYQRFANHVSFYLFSICETYCTLSIIVVKKGSQNIYDKSINVLAPFLVVSSIFRKMVCRLWCE